MFNFDIRHFLGLSYYQSELDQFLAEFDKSHPKLSTAQRLEKEKYDRIYAMRDKPAPTQPTPTLWEKF